MRCPACGIEVFEQAIFCHKCGERIAVSRDPDYDDRETSENLDPRDVFRQRSSAHHHANNTPEDELWEGGYSPKAMIGAWMMSALISILLFAAGVFFARDAVVWILLISVMLLIWIYNFFVLTYRRLSVRYRLTSQRFIHETGILRRVNDRIEVLDMDDISYVQGLLERLVGTGTIRILSTDRSHPEFPLRGIEDVKRVCETFDNARQAERRRRGLYVEQI